MTPVSSESSVTIEVSVFKGGFGVDFYERVAREYEKTHPGVKVNLWGDPRNNEKLRPRFIAGDPPDLVAAFMPIWMLIDGGQVYALDKELDSPAYDQPNSKWRDTFIPGLMSPYVKDGHVYAVNFEYSSMGLWYNARMFRENGWTVPKTWDELLDVCEKAKRKGIDPIAFQGRYIIYINILFDPLVQCIGGPKAWADAQNLKPGAWNSPAVVRTIELIQDLRRKQYIPDTYMGLSHMEAQMKFVQGKAAMITCGSWLKTEMQSNLPKDFEMAFLPIPPPAGSRGDPSAIRVGTQSWFVPAQAKHPELGGDFLKFLTSRSHGELFTEMKQTAVAIAGERRLAPDVASAEEAVKRAGFVFENKMDARYPSFQLFVLSGMLDMMFLRKSPEEIAEYLEDAAEQVRNDRRVPKHSVPVPGEEAAE